MSEVIRHVNASRSESIEVALSEKKQEGVKIKTEEHEDVELTDKEINLEDLDAKLEIIRQKNSFWPETIAVAKDMVRRLPADLQMHIGTCARIAAKYMQDGDLEGKKRRILSLNNDETKVEYQILDALNWKVHRLVDISTID